MPFSCVDGTSVLNIQHQKSNMVIVDLIALLEAKAAAEEMYASKMDLVSSMELKSEDSGLTAYQREVARLCNLHKTKAVNLRKIIIYLKSSIKDFSIMNKEIEILSKNLEKQRIDIDALYNLVKAKYQKADDQKEKEPQESIESLDLMINIGSVNMTVEDFNNTCFFLQKEAQVEDVKGFLMVTKDCYLVESFINLLSKHLEINNDTANLFLNDLIQRGMITKVSNSHLKWKKPYMDTEKPSKVATRDADVTDLEYRRLVLQGQKTRELLEQKSVEFMKKVEQDIKDRVNLVKTAFQMIMDLDAPDIVSLEESKKQLEVFVEMMDPEKESLMVVEQFRTGHCRIKPIIYYNYYTGSETIFGVPLEQTVKKFNRKIPHIIMKTVEVISDYFSSQIGVGSQLDSWINYDIDHKDVSVLIGLCDSGEVHRHELRTYPIAAVIGLLARYLLDLPNSVCSNEIYDPLKLLYLSSMFNF